ncbi:Uncharacterized protein family UPF0565 [Macleaya cordata]|uniref:Uncharacterized protein family UPF0565 n=1 Tax=Macleaya cordata TaxID=56857 RepID=A0A200QN80_MACCD|nr:Uncharacterized protein family UPF0565 [Macleaya cordata]
MGRWTGVLRVSLNPNNSRVHFKVAVSLCFSPSSKTLIVPSANAIFFNGDRIEGTGNPVIEKLSNLQNIADILVSKLGSSVNAWVVEASTFNGPFAIYKEFFRSASSYGEPKSYDSYGFPASTSTFLLLWRTLEEVKKVISGRQEPSPVNSSASCSHQPKTIIFGFSKGGTVLNQLVTELAYSKLETPVVSATQRRENPSGGNVLGIHEENQIIPSSKESLLNSIFEVHYVDVGLNSAGAYLTDGSIIERIANRMALGAAGIRFVLHGTPRQWCDSRRPRIRDEKDRLYQLLEDAELKTEGKLQVSKRLYFVDRPPDLQMHFEIIEIFEIS